MKKLYYLRHGLSELNLAGLFAGSTDTPLTEDGKQQALIAGQEAKHLKIDRIISSPLSRALETAKQFAKGARLSEDIIETENLLRERNFGSLEQTPWSHEVSSSLLNDNLPEGVEKWDDLVDRAKQVIEKVKQMPEEDILLVGHGATGRAIKFALDPNSDWKTGIPNAELVVLLGD